MRRTRSVALLVGLLGLSSSAAARAETRVIVDVGPMFGKTSSIREVDQGPEPSAPPREGAAGIEARAGFTGAHHVVGLATSLWGATAASGSLAAFGGVAARTQRGLALELTGGLGGQLYDGYMSGGFYTDVDTTSVLLPFATGQLQAWLPVGRKIFLGAFAQVRSDLTKGTGTATVIQRCGTLCDILGGHDSEPVVHSYAVGGQTLFVGFNIRFSADARIDPDRQPARAAYDHNQ